VYDTVFYIAGLGAAVWLAIVAVDVIVAVIRREWRFRLRDLLVLMVAVSLVLAVFGGLIRTMR